jgi:hypothetical protein
MKNNKKYECIHLAHLRLYDLDPKKYALQFWNRGVRSDVDSILISSHPFSIPSLHSHRRLSLSCPS